MIEWMLGHAWSFGWRAAVTLVACWTIYNLSGGLVHLEQVIIIAPVVIIVTRFEVPMTAVAQVIPFPERPKPFLKWAGGKRQLLPELRARMPKEFRRYFEPFVGGGALFFDLRASGWKGVATIGDSNELLARTYVAVRDDVDMVMSMLGELKYCKSEYLYQRARQPGTGKSNRWEDTDVAVWVIYMNRTCFNGLWRVNKKGEFNVPFGRMTNPTICDVPGLRAASKALGKTHIMIGDYARTARAAEAGDFVYFDPPYVPVGGEADFTAYTRDGFTLDDQHKLMQFALSLKQRGVHVMLSNADVPKVREIYAGKRWKIERVEAKRNINSKAGKRGPVGEVIII